MLWHWDGFLKGLSHDATLDFHPIRLAFGEQRIVAFLMLLGELVENDSDKEVDNEEIPNYEEGDKVKNHENSVVPLRLVSDSDGVDSLQGARGEGKQLWTKGVYVRGYKLG